MSDRKVVKVNNEKIAELLKDNKKKIKTYFLSLNHPPDIKKFLSCIDKEFLIFWFRLIKKIEIRSEVFSSLEKELRVFLIKHLESLEVAFLINYLESDDAVNVVREISLKKQVGILDKISEKKRKQVYKLIGFPHDVAGGIMQVELASVKYNDTVSIAVDKVRNFVDKEVEILAVWVVDRYNRLLGSVALVDLLLHKARTRIGILMERQVISVNPLVDQEKVVQIFQKYNLITLPVIDHNNVLLGRIVIDDIIDVLSEETDEDTMHMAGTSIQEIKSYQSILYTVKIRFPWLAFALLYSLISAFLLKFFEPILEKGLFFFILLPVITAMAGNIGTQSATVLIRSFAQGKFFIYNLSNLILKEIIVGAIVGSTYGVLTGLIAVFAFANGNYYVGLCIFLAMTIAMSIAAAMGILAPSILRILKFDPAIASGPFVTTLNDITGILVFMVIAKLFIIRIF